MSHPDDSHVSTAEAIRSARLARGWSVAEAARQLRRISTDPLPGIDSIARSWKRWEAGTDPTRYRPLLAELFPVEFRAAPRGLVAMYPHRASVPAATWLGLLDGAERHVDVLAWAATFFHQQPQVAARLAQSAARGARVRLCFANPESSTLATRELEEPLLGPGVLAQKVRVSLSYFRELVDVDGVEIRLHSSVVYASLFRYDDEIIVNPHVYSRPASENPALHLRRGDMFDAYTRSLEVVWERAEPWKGEQV